MSTTIHQIKSVDPDKLVGLKANLYYVNELNRFQLGSVLFEVIEDKSDGYRSYYQELQVIDTNKTKNERDFLAEVQIEKVHEQSFEGYDIIDNDGHVWVRFGTDNNDDYYPCFVFCVTPKSPK